MELDHLVSLEYSWDHVKHHIIKLIKVSVLAQPLLSLLNELEALLNLLFAHAVAKVENDFWEKNGFTWSLSDPPFT